jgi:hypothetical protein
MHFGFGLAASVATLWFAQAASAECFQPGQARQPTKATFADGASVEILERTAHALHYRSRSQPTSVPIELKNHGGLFTLFSAPGTLRFQFNWREDLSTLFPLKVGQKSSATADIEGNPPRAFTSSIEVVAAETLRIGACDYPVLKIIQTSGDVGKGTVSITRYLNPDSMMTLRTERAVPATATEPAKIVANQMVTLE